MYDPHVLQEEWDKKYSTAAKAFIGVNVLFLLVLAAFAFGFSSISRTAGDSERATGFFLLFLGMVVVVGTGLIKKWRWAAIVAALWCLAIIGGNLYSAASQDTKPKSTSEKSAHFEAGESVGTGCGGLMVLIVLIASARAAFAKAPPRTTELEVDPDLRSEFDLTNPYGMAAVTEARKLPTVALAVIAAGVCVAVGGAGLTAFGITQRAKAHHIAEEDWRTIEGPGCTAEFPGSPSIERGLVTNVPESSSYLWSSPFQKLELVHYRIPPNAYMRPEGLEVDLANLRKQLGATLVKSEIIKISGHDAVRHSVRDEARGRSATLLGVTRGRDVYILTALDVDSDVSYRDRFIESFKLTGR